MPAALGRTAYRVVQEALTNARKHAAGQPVRSLLGGAPRRRPADRRHATRPARTRRRRRSAGRRPGLVGLRERVQLAGGRLDADAGRGAVPAHGVAAVAGVSRARSGSSSSTTTRWSAAGCAMMLDGADGIEVVGEAGDGDEVAAALTGTRRTWC